MWGDSLIRDVNFKKSQAYDHTEETEMFPENVSIEEP